MNIHLFSCIIWIWSNISQMAGQYFFCIYLFVENVYILSELDLKKNKIQLFFMIETFANLLMNIWFLKF